MKTLALAKDTTASSANVTLVYSNRHKICADISFTQDIGLRQEELSLVINTLSHTLLIIAGSKSLAPVGVWRH